MALREFVDRNGREWRVWDVKPETLHPSTRAEDFMRDYLAGWLTFESVDGEAKCRLTPIPRNWESAEGPELERWLHEAEAVRGERNSNPQARAEIEAAVKSADDQATVAPASRTFDFPNGHRWTVAEWTVAGEQGEHRVLRFSAATRSLDLVRFPREWASLSDAGLAMLLAESFPRDHNRTNPTTYHRRAADRPAE